VAAALKDPENTAFRNSNWSYRQGIEVALSGSLSIRHEVIGTGERTLKTVHSGYTSSSSSPVFAAFAAAMIFSARRRSLKRWDFSRAIY